MDLDHQGCAGSGQPTAFLPEEALNGLDQDWNVLTSHVKPGPVKQEVKGYMGRLRDLPTIFILSTKRGIQRT